jgi:hypothetical protein
VSADIIDYHKVDQHADKGTCKKGIKFITPLFPDKENDDE